MTASCAVTLLRTLVQLVAVAEPSVPAFVLGERIATPARGGAVARGTGWESLA